jgi:hypothetical protein
MAHQPGTTELFVHDNVFGLLEDADWDEDDDNTANGLVSPVRRGAYVYTGIHTGYVRVTAVALEGPPGDPDTEAWEEVVDVSVKARRGRLRVRSFEDEAPALPLLTPGGRGWYRCRVHARGRDLLTDGTADTPVEDYLIQVWGDEALDPQVVHRATDKYGESLREG